MPGFDVPDLMRDHRRQLGVVHQSEHAAHEHDVGVIWSGRDRVQAARADVQLGLGHAQGGTRGAQMAEQRGHLAGPDAHAAGHAELILHPLDAGVDELRQKELEPAHPLQRRDRLAVERVLNSRWLESHGTGLAVEGSRGSVSAPDPPSPWD